MNFSELHAWADSIKDQTDGVPSSVCETGELYVTFCHKALSRPEDVSKIEEVVAEGMGQLLSTYIKQRHGRLYWRTRLETVVNDWEIVSKIDINGPDEDFVTVLKCFKDKNWKRVGAYCRLYKANFSLSH